MSSLAKPLMNVTRNTEENSRVVVYWKTLKCKMFNIFYKWWHVSPVSHHQLCVIISFSLKAILWYMCLKAVTNMFSTLMPFLTNFKSPKRQHTEILCLSYFDVNVWWFVKQNFWNCFSVSKTYFKMSLYDHRNVFNVRKRTVIQIFHHMSTYFIIQQDTS